MRTRRVWCESASSVSRSVCACTPRVCRRQRQQQQQTPHQQPRQRQPRQRQQQQPQLAAWCGIDSGGGGLASYRSLTANCTHTPH
eukprot:COSAG02_NODE_1853_length_10660_cov_23.960231_4_plen_85_part_00